MTLHLAHHAGHHLSRPREAARPKLATVRRHLHRHGADLVAALGHVAGAPGRVAGERLIREIATAPALLSRHVSRLELLRGLLLLEHLDDPESIFPAGPGVFALNRPAVHDCCRLADDLDALLQRIGADWQERTPATAAAPAQRDSGRGSTRRPAPRSAPGTTIPVPARRRQNL